MLSDLESRLLTVADQQVPGVLIVDLQHAEGHLIRCSSRLLLLNVLELQFHIVNVGII